MRDTPDMLAEVSGLRVEAPAGAVLDGVGLTVFPGELLGVVGESGSGKTTLALALLGASPPGTRITGGRVTVAEAAMLQGTEAQRRRLRGDLVAYVPQDSALALNPAMRIGDQIAEVARAHPGPTPPDELGIRAMQRAGLPSERPFLRRWPHQISGGQQQRVTLAQALVNEPRLLVLDEPTTGLDADTRSALLAQLRQLREDTGCGMVYITHDIAAVTTIADRLAVLYAGKVVETGPTGELLKRPRHPYTAALLAAVPAPALGRRPVGLPGGVPPVGARQTSGCGFAPRCALAEPGCRGAAPTEVALAERHLVACHRHDVAVTAPPHAEPIPRRREAPDPEAHSVLTVDGLHAVHRGRRHTVVTAAGVSFTLAAGECLALVGSSGSGKSTIARCLAGLHRPEAGEIRLGTALLAARARKRSREQRRAIQLVPQNPADSLDPSRTVGEQVARPATLLRGLSTRDAGAAALDILDRVRLPAVVAPRLPGELSGGERQRVAIARALVARPELLICDEITSALDVSVQAAVLELLAELQRDLGLAMLFISHDLDVVGTVADRGAVLAKGTVNELVAYPKPAPSHSADKRLRRVAGLRPGSRTPTDFGSSG
ncbi:ABC transporter ATP-binding protein [Streptomyces halobius]|uniref:ABC transporter ATP-binding protein n=1 Tax=Streptomyces halobius TaxID=2879846 RepID=A0ABY4LZP8_9ACTN|nr:ABC transporter ATP-binding protein [Streptomyces halobius]UQA90697.1 ABC transporter ATP-binding protein [Streptomyces halobius]